MKFIYIIMKVKLLDWLLIHFDKAVNKKIKNEFNLPL
jgi:hypothetical protein